MSFPADVLYSYLSTHVGLSALVGTRIYPVDALEQGAKPYCVYAVISEIRHYSHGGYSNLSEYRIQISCYGDTNASARAVVAQVIAALEAWPSVNPNVQKSFFENDFFIYEPETELHHIPVDFMVGYGT